MNRSKLKVSIGLLEATCLKGLSAFITDVEIVHRGDGSKYLLFSIEGPDVPEAPQVIATFTQTTKLEPCE